jgi:hypothetical protein
MPVPLNLFTGETKFIPLGQVNRSFLKATQANFRPLQVLQNSYWLIQLERNLPNQPNVALVVIMGAMGEVQAQGGGSGFNNGP